MDTRILTTGLLSVGFLALASLAGCNGHGLQSQGSSCSSCERYDAHGYAGAPYPGAPYPGGHYSGGYGAVEEYSNPNSIPSNHAPPVEAPPPPVPQNPEALRQPLPGRYTPRGAQYSSQPDYSSPGATYTDPAREPYQSQPPLVPQPNASPTLLNGIGSGLKNIFNGVFGRRAGRRTALPNQAWPNNVQYQPQPAYQPQQVLADHQRLPLPQYNSPSRAYSPQSTAGAAPYSATFPSGLPAQQDQRLTRRQPLAAIPAVAASRWSLPGNQQVNPSLGDAAMTRVPQTETGVEPWPYSRESNDGADTAPTGRQPLEPVDSSGDGSVELPADQTQCREPVHCGDVFFVTGSVTGSVLCRRANRTERAALIKRTHSWRSVAAIKMKSGSKS